MKSSEENEEMSHVFLLEHRFNSLPEFLASQILYAIYFITSDMSHWTVFLKICSKNVFISAISYGFI